MPVLPPTEESTCASSVVGTCTKSSAAAHDRGGEAGEVADHAAAERDHEIAALDARREQRVADLLEACAKLFELSPGGTRFRRTRCRRAQRGLARAAR